MVDDGVYGLYRLGMLYALYRIVVAIILFVIYIFNFDSFQGYYNSLTWYFLIVIGYLCLSTIQFALFGLSQSKRDLIIPMGLVDVLCLSALNFSIGHISMHIGMLFVVTVFVLNLAQTKKAGLILTLASIISVVYLPFLDSVISTNSNNSLLNSIILAAMFMIVSVAANLMVVPFRKLLAFSREKTNELEQLKETTYRLMEEIDTGYLVVNEKQEIILTNKAAQKVLNTDDPAGIQLQNIDADLARCVSEKTALYNGDFSFTHTFEQGEFYVRCHNLNLEKKVNLLTLESMQNINEQLHKLKLVELGQLSASIAHEIRNPLSTIIQAVGLVDGSEKEKIDRYCQIIKKQCGRINGIIQSTLDMAHSNSFNPSALSLGDFLESLMSEDLMDISSKIKVIGNTEVKIIFDEDHLKQVLTNLIRNAVRHNNEAVSSFVELRVADDKDLVKIDVVDFGEGVSKEVLKNLFLAFFTTEKSGTGLGLYLSKSLCESNQASIEYVDLGAGACFQLTCRKFK